MVRPAGGCPPADVRSRRGRRRLRGVRGRARLRARRSAHGPGRRGGRPGRRSADRGAGGRSIRVSAGDAAERGKRRSASARRRHARRPPGSPSSWPRPGVTILPGRGRLVGPGRLRRARPAGEVERELLAGRIILATGSAPALAAGRRDGRPPRPHQRAPARRGRARRIADHRGGGADRRGTGRALPRPRRRGHPGRDARAGSCRRRTTNRRRSVQAALVADGVRVVTAHRVIGAAADAGRRHGHAPGHRGPRRDHAARRHAAAGDGTTTREPRPRPGHRRRRDRPARATSWSTATARPARRGSTRSATCSRRRGRPTPRCARRARPRPTSAAIPWRRCAGGDCRRGCRAGPELASLGLTAAQAAAEGCLADVQARRRRARGGGPARPGRSSACRRPATGAIALVRGAAAILSPADAARPDPALLPDPVPADLAAGRAVLAAAGIAIPVV